MKKTVARSIVYDFIAKALLYPDKTTYNTFTYPEFVDNLKGAVRLLQEDGEASMDEKIDEGINDLREMSLDGFLTKYENIFGTHTQYIKVVLHQTEIQVEKNKPAYMLQAHDLADLNGFYKAFGFEVDKIRPDHFGVEMEFMHMVTLKEFQASKDGEEEKQAICVDAEKKFLLSYLGPSAPVFSKGLIEITQDAYFKFVAEIFAWFIERELAFLNIVIVHQDDSDEPLVSVSAIRGDEEGIETNPDCTTCATSAN